MTRESPEVALEHARAAMSRGELLKVFACLDANDRKRVAENAVAMSLSAQIDTDDEIRQWPR